MKLSLTGKNAIVTGGSKGIRKSNNCCFSKAGQEHIYLSVDQKKKQN